MSTGAFTLTYSLPEGFPIQYKRIAIVKAAWNTDITGALTNGALVILNASGVLPENIILLDVPGSFELPLGASHALNTLKADAVICIGCLVKGDTPHFEFISESVSHGLMRLNLDSGKPVIFGVITTLTQQQALDRAGGILGNKGEEAAYSALQMLALTHKS